MRWLDGITVLSRGDRDHGDAFQTHPVSQASSCLRKGTPLASRVAQGPEKPAGTTHSSRSDLSPREQLESPDTSSKATLWVKLPFEGALTPPCVVRKNPYTWFPWFFRLKPRTAAFPISTSLLRGRQLKTEKEERELAELSIWRSAVPRVWGQQEGGRRGVSVGNAARCDLKCWLRGLVCGPPTPPPAAPGEPRGW